jgi:hypothetical protein
LSLRPPGHWEPAESVVLCEGFDDRAFWAGWLLHLGCTDPGIQPGKSNRQEVRDPWDNLVKRSEFGFRALGNQFIRVVPCHGNSNIDREASRRLKERETRALDRLVLSYDVDGPPSETDARIRSLEQSAESLARDFGGQPSSDGWRLGETLVNLACWHSTEPSSPHLPDQQTLERLICAAFGEVYPKRGECVATWLASRSADGAAGARHFAWSHYAGWNHGTGDFYRLLWDNPGVAAALEAELRRAGLWQMVEEMVANNGAFGR